MSTARERLWIDSMFIAARFEQAAMRNDQWEKWDRCYGDEWVNRINGMSDFFLEMAFVMAIDLAGDLP